MYLDNFPTIYHDQFNMVRTSKKIAANYPPRRKLLLFYMIVLFVLPGSKYSEPLTGFLQRALAYGTCLPAGRIHGFAFWEFAKPADEHHLQIFPSTMANLHQSTMMATSTLNLTKH